MNISTFAVTLLTGALCIAAFGCSRPDANANAVPAPPVNSANSSAPADNTVAGANEAYPQEVEDEFLRSCQAAGSSAKLCACLFDKIQEKYSLEEFAVIELKLSSGDPPDDFVEFTGRAKAQCVR